MYFLKVFHYETILDCRKSAEFLCLHHSSFYSVGLLNNPVVKPEKLALVYSDCVYRTTGVIGFVLVSPPAFLFSSHAASRRVCLFSSDLLQFLSLSLSFIILLKSTGQLFCRISLNLNLSNAFLLVKVMHF